MKKAIDDLLLMKNRKITFWIFVFLFLIRLIGGFILATTQNYGYPPFNYFYTAVFLVFITFIIWLNKKSLSELNIGRYFIYIFILSSTLLLWYFNFSLFSVIPLACSVLTLRVLHGQRFEHNDKKHNSKAFLFVILGIVPIILLKFLAHDLFIYVNYFMKLGANRFFGLVIIVFWGVVSEEFLFRGLLWMILSNWKFDNRIILVIQAFLFWLVHLNYISRASFGMVPFLLGLWLGYLALRSKSLTPSIFTHFIWNITAAL